MLGLVFPNEYSRAWLIVEGDLKLGLLLPMLLGVFGLGWMMPLFYIFVTASGGEFMGGVDSLGGVM